MKVLYQLYQEEIDPLLQRRLNSQLRQQSKVVSITSEHLQLQSLKISNQLSVGGDLTSCKTNRLPAQRISNYVSFPGWYEMLRS